MNGEKLFVKVDFVLPLKKREAKDKAQHSQRKTLQKKETK
jgi:hypothetical protein